MQAQQPQAEDLLLVEQMAHVCPREAGAGGAGAALFQTRQLLASRRSCEVSARFFTVYTVRSGDCRPKPVDPALRLLTRDERGVPVSYPERIGFPPQQRPLVIMSFNIAGHDVFTQGVPHDLLTRLRHEAPIFRHRSSEPEQPDFFWAVTRHADVITVSRACELYSSAAKRCLLIEDRWLPNHGKDWDGIRPGAVGHARWLGGALGAFGIDPEAIGVGHVVDPLRVDGIRPLDEVVG